MGEVGGQDHLSLPAAQVSTASLNKTSKNVMSIVVIALSNQKLVCAE